MEITDTDVKFHDAAYLWGKDTYATEDAIKQQIGIPDAGVMVVGPAGEKRVRFHPENIGLGSVGAEGTPFTDTAFNLIDLLVVLMRPHVWREGSRQGVEDHLFQPVCQGCVTQDRHQ